MNKKSIWLWVILIIVILAAAVDFSWLYWGKKTGTTIKPTSSPSSTDELTSIGNDLQKVDSDFEKLDKIDASEDEALTL